MTKNWKRTVGAVALSAVALSAISNTAFAYEEKGNGQHLDQSNCRNDPSLCARKVKTKPADTPSVNKGKSATIPLDPAAVDCPNGCDQILDRDRRRMAKPEETPADTSADDPCKRPATQCDPRDGGASTQRGKSGTIKTNPSIAARNKTGWIVPTVAALAVAGGVALAVGGKENPKSP
jgi:hypothetical protein